MRLLADENFPKSMVEMLRAEGNDVFWARTDGSGQKDASLLDIAESEARIVLTLDKDFWQLAVQRRVPLERSGVVLFRIHPATPQNLLPLVRAFVQADMKWKGQISILGTDGIQMLASRKRLEQ
jgi:predicted nuclease of predicted toxin-antitoxin system